MIALRHTNDNFATATKWFCRRYDNFATRCDISSCKTLLINVLKMSQTTTTCDKTTHTYIEVCRNVGNDRVNNNIRLFREAEHFCKPNKQLQTEVMIPHKTKRL